MPRSIHGGRHELGQNFLIHRPTVDRITAIVARTSGPILELGAGDGALTRPLARLGRPLTAIDIDEHRVRALRAALPEVRVEVADATRHPLSAGVVVGNIPFHLTTPLLRRLLSARDWRHAVLLTQWEVARKRAAVGGATMMTAQTAPWFEFSLEGRVPAGGFAPRPSVDGGLLSITRRSEPLLPDAARPAYERFVRAVFTGRGSSLAGVVARAAQVDGRAARRALGRVGASATVARDVPPARWAEVWRALSRR